MRKYGVGMRDMMEEENEAAARSLRLCRTKVFGCIATFAQMRLGSYDIHLPPTRALSFHSSTLGTIASNSTPQ